MTLSIGCTYPALMPNWVLDLYLVQNGTIIKRDEQGVAD